MKKFYRVETSFVVEVEEQEMKKFINDLSSMEVHGTDSETILTASRVVEIPKEQLKEYVDEIEKLFPAKANQVLASHFSKKKGM